MIVFFLLLVIAAMALGIEPREGVPPGNSL